MRVRDVMTYGVETVGVEDTLQAAALRMKELGVGALIVRSEAGAVGIVTDRDIVVRGIAAGAAPTATPVRAAMTANLVECREDDELEAAAVAMERGAVRRVVVVDERNEPVGLLSVDDVALRAPALAGEIVEHVRAPERPIRRGPWPWWESPGR